MTSISSDLILPPFIIQATALGFRARQPQPAQSRRRLRLCPRLRILRQHPRTLQLHPRYILQHRRQALPLQPKPSMASVVALDGRAQLPVQLVLSALNTALITINALLDLLAMVVTDGGSPSQAPQITSQPHSACKLDIYFFHNDLYLEKCDLKCILYTTVGWLNELQNMPNPEAAPFPSLLIVASPYACIPTEEMMTSVLQVRHYLANTRSRRYLVCSLYKPRIYQR